MAGDEAREMRIFTRGLFERSPDLSVLSQSTVRSKFLAHTGRSALSPQERQILKKIVEEELLRMQEEEASDDEPLIMKVQKRARRDSDEDKVPPGKRQKRTDDNESEEDSGIEQRDIKRLSGSSPEAPVSKKVPEKAVETATAVKVDGHKRRIKTTPKRGKETIHESSDEADDVKVAAWKQKKGSDSSSDRDIKESSSRPQDDYSDSEVEMVTPKQKVATKKESACVGEDRSKKAKAVKKPLENETDSDGEDWERKKKGGKEKTATRTESKPQVKVKRAQGKGRKVEESAGKRTSKKKTTKKDSDSEESAASSEEEERSGKRLSKKKVPKNDSDSEEENAEHTKTLRKDSDSEEESAESKKDSDGEQGHKKMVGKGKTVARTESKPQVKVKGAQGKGHKEEESAGKRTSKKKTTEQDSEESAASSKDSDSEEESAASKKDSDGEERGRKKMAGKGKPVARTESKPQVKVKGAQGKGHKEEESAGKRTSKKKTTEQDSEESAASSKDSDSEEESAASKKDSDGEERGRKKMAGKGKPVARTESKPQVKVKRAQGKGHKDEESAGKRTAKKTTKKDSEESAASSKDSDSEEEERSGKTKTLREDSNGEESAASTKESESDKEKSAKKRAPKNNHDGAGEKRPPTKKTSSDEEDESDRSTDSDGEKSKPVANKSKETGGKRGMAKKTAPEESDSDKERTKKKTEGKDGGDSDSSEKSEVETKGKNNKKQSASKEEHPSIVRLKKYILTCGARKNYKKLFQDCRSVKSMVEVLKKELEDLGVKGKPSLEKCRVVRLKREEAAELAELDTSNIIATAGRPRRRNTWNPYQTSPKHESSLYHKTVGSDSEGEEGPPRKKRPMDWSSLRGIISDGDSD